MFLFNKMVPALLLATIGGGHDAQAIRLNAREGGGYSSSGVGRRERVGEMPPSAAAGGGAGAGADPPRREPAPIDARRRAVLEDGITPEQLHRCKTPYLVLQLTSGLPVGDKSTDNWEKNMLRAFRKASLRYHPDKNPDKVEWADQIFKHIGEARTFIEDRGKMSSDWVYTKSAALTQAEKDAVKLRKDREAQRTEEKEKKRAKEEDEAKEKEERLAREAAKAEERRRDWERIKNARIAKQKAEEEAKKKAETSREAAVTEQWVEENGGWTWRHRVEENGGWTWRHKALPRDARGWCQLCQKPVTCTEARNKTLRNGVAEIENGKGNGPEDMVYTHRKCAEEAAEKKAREEAEAKAEAEAREEEAAEARKEEAQKKKREATRFGGDSSRLRTLLEELKQEQFMEAFLDAGIGEPEHLIPLTVEFMQELGLTAGHQRKLSLWIESEKKREETEEKQRQEAKKLALSMYEQGLEDDTGTFLQKFPKGIMEVCEKAARLNPTCAETWYRFGRVALESRKYEQAKEAFEKAAAMEPKNAEYAKFFALSMYKQGKKNDAGKMMFPEGTTETFGKAVELCKVLPLNKKAVKLNPTCAAMWRRYGQVANSEELQKIACQEAADAYEKMIKFSPESDMAPDWHTNRGAMLEDKLENDVEAEAAFRQAIRQNKTHIHANKLLANLLDRTGKQGESQAVWMAWVEADAQNAGEALLDKGRFAEAADALEKATALDSQSAKAYHKLGQALYNLEKYEDAKKAFYRANKILPNAMTCTNLGKTRMALKEYEGAKVAFEEAVTTFNSKKASAYEGLGDARYALEDFNGAKEAYKLAIKNELSPSISVYQYFKLGKTLGMMSEYENARRVYEEAISRCGSDPDKAAAAHYKLGSMLYALKDFEGAKRHHACANDFSQFSMVGELELEQKTSGGRLRSSSWEKREFDVNTKRLAYWDDAEKRGRDVLLERPVGEVQIVKIKDVKLSSIFSADGSRKWRMDIFIDGCETMVLRANDQKTAQKWQDKIIAARDRAASQSNCKKA